MRQRRGRAASIARAAGRGDRVGHLDLCQPPVEVEVQHERAERRHALVELVERDRVADLAPALPGEVDHRAARLVQRRRISAIRGSIAGPLENSIQR